MNLNRSFLILANLLLITQLSACASAPEYLYTIEAASAIKIRPLDPELPYVSIGPINLPELIDRPQLVVRNGEYSIDINEQQRWATPLKESLPRVIAAELGEKISNQNFVTLTSSVTQKINARLLIDISVFDMSAQGVNLIARWSYLPTNKTLKNIEGVSQVNTELKAVSKNVEYTDFVNATRQATLALADDIAKQIANRF